MSTMLKIPFKNPQNYVLMSLNVFSFIVYKYASRTNIRVN